MRKVQRHLDPKKVRAKMVEFRQDPTAFYETYGGGPSVAYDLIDEKGRRYPPAAIVQAALGWFDVKAGVKARDSAGRALKIHGFRVVKKGKPLRTTCVDLDSALARLKSISQTDGRMNAKTRIGAKALRNFALNHRVRCEVTEISEPDLLRVSHIVPWREAKEHRLNPENIILLSSLWDAAFDQGLVSFDGDGAALLSKALSKHTRQVLQDCEIRTLALSEKRRQLLAVHRAEHGFK